MKRSGFARRKGGKATRRARRKKSGRWSRGHADRLFSRWIKQRDPICVACEAAPSYDCSHYWVRRHSSVRFDPDNCVGLCRLCHSSWELKKRSDYYVFMINRLGGDGYRNLEVRAMEYQKLNDAIWEFQSQYTSMV